MKTAVVYFSQSGFTAALAKAMAETLNAELIELKTKEDLVTKKPSLTSIIKSGSQVLLKKKPELAPYQFDPEIYDLIIIGTPVWAWSFAPPLRTFFNDHSLEDKKVALFITHQGGPGKTLANMETELPNARIIAKRDFHNEKDKISRSVSNARLWAASILK